MKYLIHLLVAIVLSTTLSCGQDTPLADYKPNSPQEEALKTILMNFQVGVNTKDSKKISDLLDENASIMIGRDRKIVSKAEYIKILPQRLAENPPVTLGKPKMSVSDNKAEVKIYMSRESSRVLVTFHMQLDNNTWYIKSWEY
ncbi:MAG: hypothetical protein HKO79_10395 [Desulfobacterales bacterium]|nr:hypothetical protein [Deltaproteobacteria bacterium]NNL42889.1 hypothetical protein [Desulfobacterales bacterium]